MKAGPEFCRVIGRTGCGPLVFISSLLADSCIRASDGCWRPLLRLRAGAWCIGRTSLVRLPAREARHARVAPRPAPRSEEQLLLSRSDGFVGLVSTSLSLSPRLLSHEVWRFVRTIFWQLVWSAAGGDGTALLWAVLWQFRLCIALWAEYSSPLRPAELRESTIWWRDDRWHASVGRRRDGIRRQRRG